MLRMHRRAFGMRRGKSMCYKPEPIRRRPRPHSPAGGLRTALPEHSAQRDDPASYRQSLWAFRSFERYFPPILQDTDGSKLFHKFQSRGHYFGNRLFGRRFAINPQQGLGSGLPEKNPTIFLDKDFDAIQFPNFLDAAAGECGRRRGLPGLDDRLAGLDRNVQVAAAVMKLAELVPHLANELSATLAGSREQIEKQKIDKNSVTLGQMPRESNASALLTADENFIFQHQFADVFESDGTLVKLKAKLRRDTWNQQALRIRARHRSTPAFVAVCVKQEQR